MDPTHLADELKRAAKAFEIDRRIKEHPYGMIAAALGIGFVIGGGLFRPFAASLFRTGFKAAFLPLAQHALVGLVVKLATDRETPGEHSRPEAES